MSSVLLVGLAVAIGLWAARSWKLKQALTIPRQAAFVDPAPALAAAGETWERALDQFRSAPDDTEALMRTEPLLRTLWTQWPDSEYAVRAQLMALGLERQVIRFPNVTHSGQSQDFALRAARLPDIYFSKGLEAASQNVVAEAIRRLAQAGKPGEAWRLCLRVRWSAPRIDRIAPACRDVIARHPRSELRPNDLFTELPRTVLLSKLDPATCNAATRTAIRQYLANPYEGWVLEKLIVALWNTSQRPLAEALKPELLQLEYEALWRVELTLAGKPRPPP